MIFLIEFYSKHNSKYAENSKILVTYKFNIKKQPTHESKGKLIERMQIFN